MPGPRESAGLDTGELRRSFLVDSLFADGELRAVLTDMDRLLLGGCMPAAPMRLEAAPELRCGYFAERRELGIVNLGEAGHVRADGERYTLQPFDFLYIGAGTREIWFEPSGALRPRFYFLSCPAHTRHPIRQIGHDEVPVEVIGEGGAASRRRLRKYIHPGGAASCQLVMGLTELEEGSVWNTMPPHTHSRRSEIYLYSGLGDGVVVHLMGEPQQTRHLLVSDFQAVLSPAWSIHCGAGTRPYSFVWGMAGENQDFTDMDPLEPKELR